MLIFYAQVMPFFQIQRALADKNFSCYRQPFVLTYIFGNKEK